MGATQAVEVEFPAAFQIPAHAKGVRPARALSLVGRADGAERTAPHSLRDCLLSAFDAMAHGVALLYADSRALHINRLGRQALDASGWALVDGVLRSPDAAEQQRWQQALRQVCLRERRALLEIGAAPHPRLDVAISPVIVDADCLALVSFGRAGYCGALELQMFAARHGLSHAEQQVLHKLAQGGRPADIAAAHEVAMSTVKSQIMAIRAKTQSASVQDLLHKLSRLPAVQPAWLT